MNRSPLYKHPFIRSQLTPDVRFSLAIAPFVLCSCILIIAHFYLLPALPLPLHEIIVAVAVTGICRRWGYVVNKLYCRFWLGWSNRQAARVFDHTEVPANWLKGAPEYQVPPCPYQKWAALRLKGKSNYVWRYGTLPGAGLGLIADLFIMSMHQIVSLTLLAGVIIVMAFCTSVYSAWYWKQAEREFAKYKKGKYSGQAN